MSVDSAVQKIWYGRTLAARFFACILLPFSALFAGVAILRRKLFLAGVLRAHRVSRPVIVIGNITVGGTGKTPFVIWLAHRLRERGLHPGIITRGYGGRATQWPQVVTDKSDPVQIGDEAALLAREAGCVVVAGPDRVADAQRAIELGADVVLSDDGLQHYRLQRDAEIVLFDAERGVGNGWFLPAGPLREGQSRARAAALCIAHRRGEFGVRHQKLGARFEPEPANALEITSRLADVRSVVTDEGRTLASFAGQAVNAIAGIGHPEAFFSGLRAAGIVVLCARSLPDHAQIAPADIRFADALPVLMTDKDAVKCRAFADERCWSVGLNLVVDADQQRKIMQVVDAALVARTSSPNR